MRTVNVLAIIGVGFLAIGAMFSVTDLMLFDNSYVLLVGPILWIVGCALMVAWAVGHVAISMDHAYQQKSPRLREESRAGAAAAGSGEGCRVTLDFSKVHLAGEILADLLAPLAIWLVLLSFVAVIVLLLG